jgi:hypothetical protein
VRTPSTTGMLCNTEVSEDWAILTLGVEVV